jgi:hypothetical protein
MMQWRRQKMQMEGLYIIILWMDKMTIQHSTMILASCLSYRQSLCRPWHWWATCQITEGSACRYVCRQLLGGIHSCCNSRGPWPHKLEKR